MQGTSSLFITDSLDELNAKKDTPEQIEKKVELNDKKKKIDKSKTVKEIDREKLDAKFAKKAKSKLS